jgi:hypothetical protein
MFARSTADRLHCLLVACPLARRARVFAKWLQSRLPSQPGKTQGGECEEWVSEAVGRERNVGAAVHPLPTSIPLPCPWEPERSSTLRWYGGYGGRDNMCARGPCRSDAIASHCRPGPQTPARARMVRRLASGKASLAGHRRSARMTPERRQKRKMCSAVCGRPWAVLGQTCHKRQARVVNDPTAAGYESRRGLVPVKSRRCRRPCSISRAWGLRIIEIGLEAPFR